MNNIDFAYLYTSVEGRIGRKDFWLGVLGFVVVGIIVLGDHRAAVRHDVLHGPAHLLPARR